VPKPFKETPQSSTPKHYEKLRMKITFLDLNNYQESKLSLEKLVRLQEFIMRCSRNATQDRVTIVHCTTNWVDTHYPWLNLNQFLIPDSWLIFSHQFPPRFTLSAHLCAISYSWEFHFTHWLHFSKYMCWATV